MHGGVHRSPSFGFEPIAAYYFSKTTEIKAVRIVLCAKQSGVSTDIIESSIKAYLSAINRNKIQ